MEINEDWINEKYSVTVVLTPKIMLDFENNIDAIHELLWQAYQQEVMRQSDLKKLPRRGD